MRGIWTVRMTVTVVAVVISESGQSFLSLQVTTTEWLMLLRGAGLVTNPKKNPMPDMLPELSWNLLFALEEAMPDAFAGLVDDVIRRTASWREWVQLGEPQQSPLPSPWCDSLNGMQKMLVLKAFREEKVRTQLVWPSWPSTVASLWAAQSYLLWDETMLGR